MPIVSSTSNPDFQLHTLGWKAFQDLCLTVLGDQLGQAVKRFSPLRDGGRDGAFVGTWQPTPALELSGETVVQCKFTNRRDSHLSFSAFREETKKAKLLWSRRHRDNYVLLTNYRVTAEFEESVSRSFERFGCHNFHVFGHDWLVAAIQQSARLRTLVPRLYGLGDLSQIMDERWYLQTRKLLEAERDNLRKFVPTGAYRRAVNALNKHSFVLLLGEPAVGKTAIAATLALASGDAWRCQPMKLEQPMDLRDRWNPEDPKQLFWIDDAFGTTQYNSGRVHEWNQVLPWLGPVLKSGAKLILTSRGYIYARAKRDMKQSAFPLMRESQVVVNVAEITREEREQILYNHVKMGNQPRKWRRAFKRVFDVAAQHPEFRPEIARRLGTSEFTRRLNLSGEAVSKFVAEPEEFLRETIEVLSSDDQAALGAIFIRGGRLRSPVELTRDEEQIVSRLGGTKAGITESMVAMRDTFVRLSALDDESWVFKHPTIGDAFGSFVADNPELVDLYLSGASMSKLLTEISCGRVRLKGIRVVVPKSRFDLVIRRLHEYRSSREGSGQDLWRRKGQCLDFLANRCSKSFLERFISTTPEFWQELLGFGSYLSATSEFPVIVRLQHEGLFPPDKRQVVVDRVGELAVDIPDSDFLTVGWIRSFFTESEIAKIMAHVHDALIPKVNDVVESWRSDFFGEEDAAGYFAPLEDALKAYLHYFESDAGVYDALEEAKDKVADLIAEMESSRDEDEEEYGFDFLEAPKEVTSSDKRRRIFDDLDA
jgi:hypothetical protein